MHDVLMYASAHPRTTLVLLGLGWLLLYLVSCQIWPYKTCRWCSSGKHGSPSGSAWRSCFSCGGKRRRVRWGRRLFDLDI